MTMPEDERGGAMPGGSGERAAGTRVGWDFALMVATIALLVAIGVQTLGGTLYSWWAHDAIAGWEQGPGYAAYMRVMNAAAAPLVAGLVVVLGLCVPKRMFARRVLLAVSAGLVAFGIAAAVLGRSLETGMAAYLAAAALLQTVVVGVTLARGGGITYLTEGRGRRLGSALLHLGFIVFCFVVVALQGSPAVMLPVFFVSAILLAAGSAMSFYSRG